MAELERIRQAATNCQSGAAMHDPTTALNNIGVLVVHGVGDQDADETLKKLLAGLHRIEPNVDVEAALTNQSVSIGGRSIRFYEVYWADIHQNKRSIGSFEMNELQGLSWFPWFNWRRGSYSRGDYSWLKKVWWIVTLPILNFLIYLGYHGAVFFDTAI